MAEELSLSLVWSLLLPYGLTLLYREELGTWLDFAGFFSFSPLSLLFPRVLLNGNHPMQESFSLEAAASFPPGWKASSPSSSPAAQGSTGRRGERRRAPIPSTPHLQPTRSPRKE